MEDEAKLMRDKLTERFDRMMKVLFRQEGANLEIGILASEEAQDFIEAHSSVLNGSFRKVEMSETMRKRLERSNYVFSGLKTFHELNEAFPSLLDENGNRKTFERFLNDVRKIDETYNSNYLRAEFTFVQASAEMAAKWERFMQDGDRYYLQYRTAGDAKVRPTHAEMAGITLPASDPFWAEFYPPNGWGCRCSVVQVRKSKYPPTDHEEAMARSAESIRFCKDGSVKTSCHERLPKFAVSAAATDSPLLIQLHPSARTDRIRALSLSHRRQVKENRYPAGPPVGSHFRNPGRRLLN